MAFTCAVKNCSNGSYWLNKWKKQLCTSCGCLHKEKECTCDAPFRLFPFPTEKKNPERRARWKQLVGRKDGSKLWCPSKDSRVCSKHFIGGEPTPTNPLPTLQLGYDGHEKRVQRIQFFAEEPRKVSFRCETPGPEYTARPIYEDPPMEELEKEDTWLPWPLFMILITRFLLKYCYKLNSDVNKLKLENKKLKLQVDHLRNTKYVDSILLKNEDVTFYTGLPSRAIFEKFHSMIAPLVNRRWLGVEGSTTKLRKFTKEPGRFGPTRKLTSKAEFLLTLMRLRLGLLGKDLANRFNVSESLCARIFLAWLRACAKVFGSMVYIPDEDTLTATKPLKFSHIPSLHCVIDCTEIFIETPKDLELQCATWSEYKHHNTLKVLVACAANSAIVFMSNAYTGRISDKAITLDSGLLDEIPPYSVIMADKGFNIGDKCASRLLTLYVPPGRRGQSQMPKAAVRKTKNIANTRIIIEQVIRRLKTFKIIQSELPISLVPHIDDILQVCGGISNTKGSIYK